MVHVLYVTEMCVMSLFNIHFITVYFSMMFDSQILFPQYTCQSERHKKDYNLDTYRNGDI